MANLLQKIKAGRKNYVDVQLPGVDDATVRINILTGQDTLDSSMAADAIFKAAEINVSMANIKAYEEEKVTQCLYRSCRDLDGNPLAPTISDFRRLLTTPIKDYLTERYNALDAECNPSPDNMPDAEFDALVENVKKNPLEALSNVSNMSTLKRLALFLASPPSSLQTGSGPTSQ